MPAERWAPPRQVTASYLLPSPLWLPLWQPAAGGRDSVRTQGPWSVLGCALTWVLLHQTAAGGGEKVSQNTSWAASILCITPGFTCITGQTLGGNPGFSHFLNHFLREGYKNDELQRVMQLGIQTFTFLEYVARGLEISSVSLRVQAGISISRFHLRNSYPSF